MPKNQLLGADFSKEELFWNSSDVQPIPADMRLRISIGMPNFEMPNLDSVNHCTSDFLTATMVD